MAKKNSEEAIVEAACALFARFGFKRAPVDQIAKQAGVSKATLYSYFPSKEALFERVIQHEADAMLDEVHRTVEKAKTPPDRIRALFKGHYQALRGRLAPWDLDAGVLGEILPLAHQAAKDQVARGLEFMELLVREGRDAGVFHCPDPAAAARALQFALRSLDMSFMAMAHDDDGFREQHSALLELLVAGLQHDPNSGADR